MSAAIDRVPIPLMNFHRCPMCNGDWRIVEETMYAEGGGPHPKTLHRSTTCFHDHRITSLINLDRHSLVDGRLCP